MNLTYKSSYKLKLLVENFHLQSKSKITKQLLTSFLVDIIQLLTNEALDMMWYRPDNTNIDRGKAEVNIGILWSISHHIQCLISQ